MLRDFDQSTVHDSSSVISSSHTKDYYKKNKLSGQYKEHDPINGQLTQQGQFLHGLQVGLWKVYDQDGDEQHFRYREERVGARCQDGSYSSATGRGACSWHGGVAEWLYQNKRYQVGGTGKYEPIEARIQRAKDRLKNQLKINAMKSQQELFLQVANKLLKMNPNPQLQEKQLQQKLSAKISVLQSQYQTQLSQLQQTQAIAQQQNLKLKDQIKELKQKLASQQKPSPKHQETVQKMQISYEERLEQKQREIQQLKRQLKEAKTKGDKDKKRHDLSVSRAESDNAEIKNQIKLIQKQLAMLDKTVEAKEKKEVSYEQEKESESDYENKEQEEVKSQVKKSSTSTQSEKNESNSLQQPQKPCQKIQTDPNQPSQKACPKAKPPSPNLQSPNTSQQSHIPYQFPNHQQPSINSSISYSKILNSKLFLDQSNKSDLSMFVDLKPNNKRPNNPDRPSDTLNQSKNDQRRVFRFKPQEQSSEEEVVLKTDEEQQPYQDKNQDEEDNLEIFKSIPFKDTGKQDKQQKDTKIIQDKK